MLNYLTNDCQGPLLTISPSLDAAWFVVDDVLDYPAGSSSCTNWLLKLLDKSLIPPDNNLY
jgi:hypothetical protein